MSIYFDDHRIEAGHGRRSLHSGAVLIGARFAIAVIQVVSIIFLARLLSPEDYGLVSMVTAITGFAPLLVSLGTPDAVVQRQHITETDVSALFWFNVVLGVALAVLMAACGPVISRFYGEPRLAMIAAISGLTFVTSALSCQHYALLRRAMMFRELAILDVGANLLSTCAAIAMAFGGLEYWALVLRPVLQTSLLSLGVWLKCRWTPSKLAVTSSAKEMLSLGLNITGFALLDFVGRASDRVAIGYRSGATALGYYQNAMFVYDNALDLLVSPLHAVSVATLSKVREDLNELRRLWRKALLTLDFFSMPAFAILAVVGQDLIVLLLGAKWSHAGFLLSIMALRGIPHTTERTLGWLHVTSGRTDRWRRWGVVATFLQLVALFAGLPFGPTGVAIAFVVYAFVIFVPAVAYAGRPLGIGALDVLSVVWRPLAATLLAVVVGFLLRLTLLEGSAPIVRAMLLVAAVAAVYLITAVGLLRVTTPLRVALDLTRDVVPARFAKRIATPKFLDRLDQ